MPRWAVWAAHAAALAAIPSGLWRLPMAWGTSMGFDQDFMDALQAPGWGSVYVIVLGVLTEVFAFLTLGLVQPWGETWPRWVPFVGGRRIRPLAVVVPAALGVAAVMLYNVGYIYTAFFAGADQPKGAALWLMNACYAPMLAWPPLLAAVTVHYWRRRKADATTATV
ncbi:hypothetical protein [Actinomadura sp. 6N118]|uniref:hypothetical protein n=1 Tax=Actinomadura sp. 6N118 TaxID=3375151 RepID=UPI0037A04B7F